VLLRFDWSQRFDDSEAFYENWPYLSEDACTWLVEQGARLVGMDTPSPDNPADGFGAERDSPKHKILLGAGVILLEYMTNLDQLGVGPVQLIALPLSLPGSDGAPVRAVAVVE
jgi:arylformamidase